jgi:hypothetical protein
MGRKKGERPEGPKGSESFPALSASKEDKAKNVLVGAWAQRKRDNEVTVTCSALLQI